MTGPLRMAFRSAEEFAWWAAREAKNPYRAAAPAKAFRPDDERLADDVHLSVVLKAGVRLWCFEEEAARDRFLTLCPEARRV